MHYLLIIYICPLCSTLIIGLGNNENVVPKKRDPMAVNLKRDRTQVTVLVASSLPL